MSQTLNEIIQDHHRGNVSQVFFLTLSEASYVLWWWGLCTLVLDFFVVFHGSVHCFPSVRHTRFKLSSWSSYKSLVFSSSLSLFCCSLGLSCWHFFIKHVCFCHRLIHSEQILLSSGDYRRHSAVRLCYSRIVLHVWLLPVQPHIAHNSPGLSPDVSPPYSRWR